MFKFSTEGIATNTKHSSAVSMGNTKMSEDLQFSHPSSLATLK